MPLLLTKDLPRYECLLEASRKFPELDPSATEAFLKLLRTGDEAFRVVASQLSDFQLTPGRFAVLMALWRNCRRAEEAVTSLTPAELAEQTGVTRATMTGLVDTLERDGLVKREPAPTDRRMTTVQLTGEGMNVVQRILPGHFQMMSALMAPLSAAELQTFNGLLQKILDRASTILPGDAPSACNATAAR